MKYKIQGDNMPVVICALEDGEVASVREAIEAWRSERTPLGESLDEELLAKLDSDRVDLGIEGETRVTAA